jgi:hypothetical protein
MASDFAPAPPTPQPPPGNQPVRFTLRDLFILTALVSFAGACYSWVEAAPIPAALLFWLSSLVAVAFGFRIFTGLSLSPTLIVVGILGCFFLALAPAFVDGRGSARKMSCTNNLRNIALALQQYHDNHGTFPPAYIADAQGKPMHSWRVLLLPYFDQGNLYKQYRFDEPWDGPNNSQLHSIRPFYYQCPSDTGPRTDTSYFAIVGPQTIWPGANATRMADITDGTPNTIILAEVANSGIHWMEPSDLDASQMSMLINAAKGPGISSGHEKGANVAYANGSVQFLTNKTSPAALRAALTRNGKEAPAP